MEPITVRESAEARRWLAARSLRLPLLGIKVASPVLTIAALVVIVRAHDLAARPLVVLFALALPFAVPFLLAAPYPWVRWMPQEWTIDARGIRGRGRAAGVYSWSEIASWTAAPLERVPGHAHVVLRRRPAYRHLGVHMVVPEEVAAAIASRLRAATAGDVALPGGPQSV